MERFTFVLAGTQSGKTSWGPWWLAREIGRTADPLGGNDYIAVTASYDLFKLKMLPELLNTFCQALNMGRYWTGERVIELRDPLTGKFWANRADDKMWGRIILRSAGSGGGLESATARAAWADECGQPDFTLETWEALLRRLSLMMGRVMGTTTIYDLGWVKSHVYDRWKRVGTSQEKEGDRDFRIISFDSTENPVFPPEEFERARRDLPGWRFDMFYRGRFTRPAGQIYDCFSDTDISAGGHILARKPIPKDWFAVAGADFGLVNTCIGVYAVEEDAEGYPTGRLILNHVHHKGGFSAEGHIEDLRAVAPNLSLVVGGAGSEQQWRDEYGRFGLPIYAPPLTSVEVGIDRVYGLTRAGNLLAFEDQTEYRTKKAEYSRELDVNGDPTTTIKDKEKYHVLDQERYLASLFAPSIASLLPFDVKTNLLVGTLAEKPLPATLQRFAGLHYTEDGHTAFVLGAVLPSGKVIAEWESIAFRAEAKEFADKVATELKTRQHEKVHVLASDSVFQPYKKGEVSGPSLAEVFHKAGVLVVRAGGDGITEWSTLGDWLRLRRLIINRKSCPFLSLTLPLLVSNPLKPGSPDPRLPVHAAAALCNAMMLRPKPAKGKDEPLPFDPKNPFPDSRLPHALQSPREDRRDEWEKASPMPGVDVE